MGGRAKGRGGRGGRQEVLATLPGLTPGTRDAQLYMQLFLLVLAGTRDAQLYMQLFLLVLALMGAGVCGFRCSSTCSCSRSWGWSW
jgi:hypothetical protein